MGSEPRLGPWRKRQLEMERLAGLRVNRASVCWCSRCGDAVWGRYLEDQIRRAEHFIAQYGDQCCERPLDDELLQALDRSLSWAR